MRSSLTWHNVKHHLTCMQARQQLNYTLLPAQTAQCGTTCAAHLLLQHEVHGCMHVDVLAAAMPFSMHHGGWCTMPQICQTNCLMCCSMIL